MIKGAIADELKRAGWGVDEGFLGHLLIGNAGDLSILTPWHAGRGERTPEYELYDAQKNLACRVGVLPTPLRARMLLETHGESVFVEEEELATPRTTK